jgi:hypothetical protein
MFCPLPTWWAVTFDVAGKHPGALFGLLNSAGVIGALGSQYFFGAFADWRMESGFTGRDQWDPAFYLPAALLAAAAVLWQFVHERRAVGEATSVSDDPLQSAFQARPPDGSMREGPPPH